MSIMSFLSQRHMPSYNPAFELPYGPSPMRKPHRTRNTFDYHHTKLSQSGRTNTNFHRFPRDLIYICQPHRQCTLHHSRQTMSPVDIGEYTVQYTLEQNTKFDCWQTGRKFCHDKCQWFPSKVLRWYSSLEPRSGRRGAHDM